MLSLLVTLSLLVMQSNAVVKDMVITTIQNDANGATTMFCLASGRRIDGYDHGTGGAGFNVFWAAYGDGQICSAASCCLRFENQMDQGGSKLEVDDFTINPSQSGCLSYGGANAHAAYKNAQYTESWTNSPDVLCVDGTACAVLRDTTSDPFDPDCGCRLDWLTFSTYRVSISITNVPGADAVWNCHEHNGDMWSCPDVGELPGLGLRQIVWNHQYIDWINVAPEASGQTVNLVCTNGKTIGVYEPGRYGANCNAYAADVGIGICNGLTSCSYKIDHNIIGDPSPGCSKNYVYHYTCL